MLQYLMCQNRRACTSKKKQKNLQSYIPVVIYTNTGNETAIAYFENCIDLRWNFGILLLVSPANGDVPPVSEAFNELHFKRPNSEAWNGTL